MSELIDNAAGRRRDVLKHMLRELHGGAAPDAVRTELTRLLGEVPYGEVVEVEQELLREGLKPAQLQQACDAHAAALEGVVSLSRAKAPPPGHPVQVFRAENAALAAEVTALERLCLDLAALPDGAAPGKTLEHVRGRLHALMDVDKHYLRKEHLLFPFLEQRGVTGPPQVMWGKHDETRKLLADALLALAAVERGEADPRALPRLALRPAAAAVRGMVDKEERILLPMCLERLEEAEWIAIARQSPEIGFCLVAPETEWPAREAEAAGPESGGDRIGFPTGSFTHAELGAILNALPLDATFVDREDRVRWFSGGAERVFSRSRAIIGRKVQFCHPPSSVHVVEEILAAFRSGARDRAAFWIEMRGRFVHIEYVALRGTAGEYLGCLEVTQDLTEKRALSGERRLLAWDGGAPPKIRSRPASD
jgi:uncharacterized protein